MANNKIRIRLLKLGKRQLDLLPELEKAGFKTGPCDLSLILSGHIVTKRAESVLDEIDKILSTWEKVSKKKSATR